MVGEGREVTEMPAPSPRGLRVKAARHVSRFRYAWYAGAVAASAVAFQFGFGDLLNRALG